MKKYIIAILIILIALPAIASTIKPPAAALEWWLRGQGKFEGANVSTRQNPDGTYSITTWSVSGVTQPTDSEVDQIITNYEAAVFPNFSYATLLTSINSKFTGLKAIQLAPYLGAIQGYTNAQNWTGLKTFAQGLISVGIMNTDDYNLFNDALKEQNVDLGNF